MKKKNITIFCVIILSIGAKNKLTKINNILNSMSIYYAQLPAFHLNFTYQVQNKTENILQKITGKLWIKKKKYHLQLQDQEIFNNGKTQWIYNKKIQEVTICNPKDVQEDFSPAQFYTLFHSKKYFFKYIKQDKNFMEIQLIPKIKHKTISNIILTINTKNYHLQKWTLYDHEQNIHNFKINQFNAKVSIKDSYFNFICPKNTEKIDLRD